MKCTPRDHTLECSAGCLSQQSTIPGDLIVYDDGSLAKAGGGLRSALGRLAAVSGSLVLVADPGVQPSQGVASLDGLDRVTSVGGSLALIHMDGLSSPLSGLRALRGKLGGSLIVNEADSLVSLEGLEGLGAIEGACVRVCCRSLRPTVWVIVSKGNGCGCVQYVLQL